MQPLGPYLSICTSSRRDREVGIVPQTAGSCHRTRGGTRHDIIPARGVEARSYDCNIRDRCLELEVNFEFFVWKPGVSILQNRIRYCFVAPPDDDDMHDCFRLDCVSTYFYPHGLSYHCALPPSPFPRLRQGYNIFPYVVRRGAPIISRVVLLTP
jgi:hypothetical protein